MTQTAVAQPAPAPLPQEPNLRGHLPALDGIRGLAILGVMLYHMTVLTSSTPADRAYTLLTNCGSYGVDLFFVLSGFLITGILYDAKCGPRYFRNFYARRTLRIFPLYYAVVFFSLVILPHIPNPKAARFGSIAGDEWWYWAYLSNYLVALRQAWRHGILDVSWTLAIEEQFYLLWPAVVYLFSLQTLRRICVGIVLAALATRTAMYVGGASHLTIFVITPCKMDALAVGAWIALTVRQTGVLPWLPIARRTLYVSLGLFIAIYALGRFTWDSPLLMTLGFTTLAICFGSLVLLALPPSRSILTHPFLRMLGRYSYAIYLFNLPLRGVLRDTLYGPSRFPTFHGSQLPGQMLFYPPAIAITLAAAWLSWHLYEKQFLKLKRFFPAPHGPTPTAPPNAPAPHPPSL